MDPKLYAGYAPQEQNTGESMYKDFNATELYCPFCKMAVPVKARLLLVLPEGDKYEYLCSFCGQSIGSKMDKAGESNSLLY